VTAKAVLRVNGDGYAPNFRIQHFDESGHMTPKTTIYSRDEFEGVFNEIDSDIREAVFIQGEHKPLIELVERSHGVSFRSMTD
jgi:hypothetical protein